MRISAEVNEIAIRVGSRRCRRLGSARSPARCRPDPRAGDTEGALALVGPCWIRTESISRPIMGIPRPRSDLGRRRLPCAVVDDLDADHIRFRPEDQLDGVVRGRRGTSVIDGVARRLVEGEQGVLLRLSGQADRCLPPAYLYLDLRQLPRLRRQSRRTNSMRSRDGATSGFSIISSPGHPRCCCTTAPPRSRAASG